MKHAFEKAGIPDPRHELDRIALLALTASDRDFDRAFAEAAAKISGNPALVWELFAPWRKDALRGLLARIAEAERGKSKFASDGDGAQARSSMSPFGAVPERQIDLAQAGEEEEAAAAVPPSCNLPPPPESSARLAAIGNAQRGMFWSHRTENDTALRDCTREDLITLARRHRRFSWFYDALARPMKRNERVSDGWSPEAVEQIWARSGHANSVMESL